MRNHGVREGKYVSLQDRNSPTQRFMPFFGVMFMAGQPTPIRNSGLNGLGLINGNQWVFTSPDHKALFLGGTSGVGWLIIHIIFPINIPGPHLHHQATAASASCNAKGGCLAGKLLTPTETLGDVELELLYGWSTLPPFPGNSWTYDQVFWKPIGFS